MAGRGSDGGRRRGPVGDAVFSNPIELDAALKSIANEGSPSQAAGLPRAAETTTSKGTLNHALTDPTAAVGLTDQRMEEGFKASKRKEKPSRKEGEART